MKVYVVAGNHNQAIEYIKRKCDERFKAGDTSVSMSEYVCIDKINRLRGVSNPHGVFVGTWKDRPDIIEIVETLIIQSTSPNSSLGKILKQLKHKYKLTPVQVAADLLAKEIDNQVMKELYEKSQN